MNDSKANDGGAEPPLDCRVMPCPFCGMEPEAYVIGARPHYGEKGQTMVRSMPGQLRQGGAQDCSRQCTGTAVRMKPANAH